MKIKSLYIEAYKILQDFEINFGDSVVTVICGANGCGKTTLLDFIYETFKKEALPKGNKNSFIEVEGSELLPELFSSLPHGRHRLDSGFLSLHKGRSNVKLSDHLIYYKAGEKQKAARQQIIGFVDELIYERNVRPLDAYETLSKKIADIFKELNLGVQFSHLDKNKEIFFKNEQSDNIKLAELSGGEQEIITKIFPLYAANIRNSIILIDEPEDSMHPNWQRQILRLYEAIALQNNNQIIIATHSPFIVAAVQQENLKILLKEKGLVRVIESDTNPYGRKFDEVLSDVFRINGLRTPAVEQKFDILRSMVRTEAYNTVAFSEKMKELEGIVGKFDSELTMIRLEIKRLEMMMKKEVIS